MNNYSFQTSLPAYHDNQSEKQRQADLILSFIKSGVNNLLELSERVGLPQSTVAGRISDLISEGKIFYDGFVYYKDRKRKKIALVKIGTQKEFSF